jgi:hypothetical protein
MPTRRPHPLLPALLLLAASCPFAGPALASDDAAILLSPPYLDGNQVAVDYRVPDLFADDIVETLESGLPTRITLTFELWRDRSSWWDSHVRTRARSYRIFFDVVEERYEVYDEEGLLRTRCRTVRDLSALIARGTGVGVADLEGLNPDHRYFVDLQVRVEPLSVEEVREFERWIRGSLEKKDGGSGVSGIPRFFVGILKSVIGLGDRTHWARTESFRLRDLERGPNGG